MQSSKRYTIEGSYTGPLAVLFWPFVGAGGSSSDLTLMTIDEGSSGSSDSKAWIRGFKASTGRVLHKSASQARRQRYMHVHHI